MSWIVRFDTPNVLGLPVESSCHNVADKQELEHAIEHTPILFTIFDADEELALARGSYAGSVHDMDWPLEVARIYARNKDFTPVHINYFNGVNYSFEEDYQAVILK